MDLTFGEQELCHDKANRGVAAMPKTGLLGDVMDTTYTRSINPRQNFYKNPQQGEIVKI